MIRLPEDLPRYRLLTGPDDAAFCERVSEALSLGYHLHEGPSIAFDGDRIVAAQALVATTEANLIRTLTQENRELRRENEILRWEASLLRRGASPPTRGAVACEGADSDRAAGR